MDSYADEVRGLMDHLSIDKAVICGFSMGGYVAFAFARKYADRMLGLVLADTRPQPDAPEGKAARYQAALTAQRDGPGAIAEAMIGRLLSQRSMDERGALVEQVKGIIKNTPVQGFAGDLMTLAERPDSVPTMATIKIPTLVIVGEADTLTPPADSKLMADSIAGAKLVTIPGAAHLSNMEEPEQFNTALAGFMASIGT